MLRRFSCSPGSGFIRALRVEFPLCRRRAYARFITTGETVLCNCGKPAIERISGKRAKNPGLRFLGCADALPWYISCKLKEKPRCCRFFCWIDTPQEPLVVETSEEQNANASAAAASDIEKPKRRVAAREKKASSETDTT